MMELINPKHHRILHYSGIPTVATVNHRDVAFTTPAAKLFDITPDKYMHFINEGKEWYFIVNDDPDGFKITKEARENRTGMRVFSAALCNMIRASIPHRGKNLKFYLQDTGKEFKGCRIVEILTAKTIDQIGKD